MNEVLMLIGAFTFGYCFAYYLLKRKKKNKKKKLIAFSNITKKSMACSNQDLAEKMKEIELCEKVENLLTENEKELQLSQVEFYLKAKKKFLELITAAIAKDLQNCVVSYFVSKKSMAINCETFILAKETCQTLLQAVDKFLTEKFKPLWNLGWCSYNHLQSRVIKYPDRKTQVIEFYWFNRKILDHETKGCFCIHCRAFFVLET